MGRVFRGWGRAMTVAAPGWWSVCTEITEDVGTEGFRLECMGRWYHFQKSRQLGKEKKGQEVYNKNDTPEVLTQAEKPMHK